MASNKPGRPSSPWGNGSKQPDLEDIARQGSEWIRRNVPGAGGGGGGNGRRPNVRPPTRTLVLGALGALVVIGVMTAYYTVPSDSVAVVQRFGKYNKEVPSGLHFKIPLGVDTATIVPVKRQLKQEFGFSTQGATDPWQNSRDGRAETEMVTGDLNAALVEWVVQYRIAEPTKYLFEVRQPAATLRYVSESVMREVVGDRTVDEV
ncbi:MAG: SPFH domain-containing protein, partial [Pseudomonadota bacterium]